MPTDSEVARARDELRRVKKWHFSPFCRSVEDVTGWLLRGAAPTIALAGSTPADFDFRIPSAVDHAVIAAVDGHAAAFAGTAIVVDASLVGCDGASAPVKRVSLAGIDPGFFLSAVALGDAAEGISARIAKQPELESYRGWDIEVASPGDVFETDMSIGGICAFVSTLRNSGGYFDFVAYEGSHNANFCQQATIKGLAHSGDRGTYSGGNSTLLHFLKAKEDLPIGVAHVLGAVGYCSRPLRLYREQLPAVCVPCPDSRVIRMLPCPLDEASVGDSTMACIATVTRLPEGRLRYVALAPVSTLKEVDTTTMDARVKECAATAVRDSGRCVDGYEALVALRTAAKAKQAPPAAADEDSPKPPPAAAAEKSLEVPDRVVLVEQGLGVSDTEQRAASTQVVFFGKNLSTTGATAAQNAIFPCVAGSCSGAAALALAAKNGMPASLTPVQYSRWLNGAAMRVVHVTDGMTEAVSKTGSATLNAVFIVHPQRELSSKPTVPRQSKLEAMLSDVNVSGVSALAGPQSIVIIAMNERRYWYRGVAWPGLVDRAPNFGADVTRTFNDAKLLSIPRGRFRAPTRAVVDRRSQAAEFDGGFVDAETFTRLLCELSFVDLAKKRQDIEAALAQFTVLMSPAELDPVTRALTAALTAKADSHVKAEKAQFMHAIEQGREPGTVRDLGAIFLQKTREATAGVQWLVNALGSIMSVKGTATRRHELGRLQRKAKIAENVSAVKNMSREELWQLLEDETSEAANGTLVAHFPCETQFVRFLSAISTAMLEQTYNKTGASHMDGLVKVEPRMSRLDCYTVAALLENAETTTSTASQQQHRYLSPAQGAKERSLSITGIDNRPALPIPLLTRFVDMKHPDRVDWLSECNAAPVAKVRILLRGTISQSNAAGRFQIPPMARDIGFALVDLLFQALGSAVAGFGGMPATLSFDDSLAQTARGIMGLVLSTLASSATPLSPSWKMCCDSLRPELPDARETWWMYGLVAVSWRLTCWEPTAVARNAAFLALSIVRRFAVTKRLPLAQLLRLSSSSSSNRQHAKGSSAPLPALVWQAPEDPAATIRATVADIKKLAWDAAHVVELVEELGAGFNRTPAATEDSLGELLFGQRLAPRHVRDFWNLWAGATMTTEADSLDVLRWTVVALVDSWVASQLAGNADTKKSSAPAEDPYAPSKRHVSAAAVLSGAAKTPASKRRPRRHDTDADHHQPPAKEESRCFRCGKLGHFASECERDDVMCFNCGQGGHIAADCERPSRPKRQPHSQRKSKDARQSRGQIGQS